MKLTIMDPCTGRLVAQDLDVGDVEHITLFGLDVRVDRSTRQKAKLLVVYLFAACGFLTVVSRAVAAIRERCG